MADKQGSRRRVFLIIAGTVLILFGSFFLSEVKSSFIYQRAVPTEGQKGPWMGPWQALIASFLCFAAGGYVLSGFVGKRD
ncbi:MAG TPA: hypothetical protein VNW72_13240 [Chthoniobacterales bacterium]|jgi:hypothetical protein|nr:hypothetical protein [Chthoniobacterales bacterium]